MFLLQFFSFQWGFFLYIEAFSFLFLGWSSFLPCLRPAEQSSYNFTLMAEWVYYFRDDVADFLTLVIWNSLYQDVGYMTDTMESKVKTSTTGIKVHSSLKREVWTRNCVAVAARAVTLSSLVTYYSFTAFHADFAAWEKTKGPAQGAPRSGEGTGFEEFVLPRRYKSHLDAQGNYFFFFLNESQDSGYLIADSVQHPIWVAARNFSQYTSNLCEICYPLNFLLMLVIIIMQDYFRNFGLTNLDLV